MTTLLEKLEAARTPLYSALSGAVVGALAVGYLRRTPPPPPTVVTSGQVHTVQVVQQREDTHQQQVVTVEHVVTRVVYRDPVTGHATKEVTREQGPTTTSTSTQEVATQVSTDHTDSRSVETVATQTTKYSLGVAYLQDFRKPAYEWAPDWSKAVLTGAARLGNSPVWLEGGVSPVGHTVQLGVRYEW